MAWEKTKEGFVYQTCVASYLAVKIHTSPSPPDTSGYVVMSFDNWLVSSNSLKELADQLMWLRKELYGD